MTLLKRGSVWYVRWVWLGKRHEWAAFPSKGISQAWGTKLQGILDARRAGEPLNGELKRWVQRLNGKQSAQLLMLGLLGPADFGSPGLEGMLEQYRKHLEALNRTREHVRHTMSQIRACIAGMNVARLEDLDEAALIEFLRGLRDRFSAAYVNHHLVSLKSFIAWAVRRGHVDADPIKHVRRLNVAVEGVTRDRRALTDKESAALLRSTKRTDLDRYWLYRFALETGLRRGEIKGLKIGNVDLPRGWVHVPAAYSRKGGRLRSVPLSRSTCRDLRVYWRGKKGDSPAFYVPGRTAEWLELDLKAAGTNPHAAGKVVDFHSLRHTFASRAGTQTESFADLMELLGHKTPAMTARYAHADRDRLKRVAERLAQ